jgi:hypothetical protein
MPASWAELQDIAGRRNSAGSVLGAKTLATKKAETTAVANWDQDLADLAKAATSVESNVGTSNFIRMAGGVLTYQNAEIPGNKLNCVILNHVMENAMYDGPYDSENPQPPVCFAFGVDEDDMAPHENSSQPQNAKCKGCPKNEFGSADTGRGKACKNVRRLQLISESDLEDVPNAELAYVKLPVTSVKAWAGYVRQLAEVYTAPPLAFVTTIGTVRDAKTQFKVTFTMKEKVDKAKIGALLELRKTKETELYTPYSKQEDKPEAPAKGKLGKRKF